DSRERCEVELHAAVAHHAAEAVEEAQHLRAVALDRRAAEPAQRRVQARTVTAAREDPDVLGHARRLAAPRCDRAPTASAKRDIRAARGATGFRARRRGAGCRPPRTGPCRRSPFRKGGPPSARCGGRSGARRTPLSPSWSK